MGNLITAKQWTHSCYVRKEEMNVVVVKEKSITIDEDTREIVSVKNRLTFDDPALQNPKRRIYITLPQYRNHKYKKETEEIHKTQMYSVEDRHLVPELKNILGINPYKRMNLQQICDSPYIYNADIGMEALVRIKYNETKKHPITHFTTGSFDIETSVLGCGRINVITFIHENTIYTTALEDFMVKFNDKGKSLKATKKDIYENIEQHLGHMPDLNHIEISYKDKEGKDVKHLFNFELEIFEHELDLIKWIFSKIHKEETDFIGIWNIDYDIPKIQERLLYYKIRPEDIFSHPSVPRHLRLFYYKRDRKKTHHISDKWHWLQSTSMSQFLDSMLLYARIRKSKRKKSSYKLNAIATEELGFGKLKLDDTDISMDHPKMQSTRFPEYVVYNIQDSLIMQLMEWKNRDMIAMWNLTGDSHLSDFSKQSVMLKNSYYKFALQNGRVFATVGSNMSGPYDELLPKVGGAVLPADRCRNIGLNCIVERPDLESMILAFGSDLDFKAIYPSFKSGYGISKETKLSTTVEIEGLPATSVEPLFGGLANPRENAVWIGHDYFGLPNYEEMSKLASEAFINIQKE